MGRSKVSPMLAAGLTALGLLAAAGCGRKSSGSAAAAVPAAAPISVRTAIVESRALPRILEVTGALTAEEFADVASERDGNVSSVRVERGTYVERGAILATLDDREAKAQLDQARASLAWAEAEFARYAELRQKQVVAKSENQRK
jgi:multidrug efflux pump subunit AcrA (membrane-fusion protein)